MLIKLPLNRFSPSFPVPSFPIRVLSILKLPWRMYKYIRNSLYCFKEEAYLEDHKSEMKKSYYPSILEAVGRRGISF